MKEKLPEIGKISQKVFEELIYPRLGAKSRNVLVGPMHGVDIGIVRIGNRALALTTDPVFIVPEYGWERAAWFAIHILLSDVVTSGLTPRYLAIDFNLPMAITEEQLEIVWKTIHRECRRYGVAVVTGHTARYDNCGYPMVGGATVIAEGGLGDYVSPRFARPGDSIIVTKGPAIEASGIFAAMFPDRLAKKFGAAFARKAEKTLLQDVGGRGRAGRGQRRRARQGRDRHARRDRVRALGRAVRDGPGRRLRRAGRQGGDPDDAVRQGDLRPVRHRPVQVNQRGHAHRDVPAEEGRRRAGRAAAEAYSVRGGRRGDPQGHDAGRGRPGERSSCIRLSTRSGRRTSEPSRDEGRMTR